MCSFTERGVHVNDYGGMSIWGCPPCEPRFEHAWYHQPDGDMYPTLEDCKNKFDNHPTFEGSPLMDRLLRWFEFGQLPPHLQAVSKPFGELARHVCDTIPSGPERTVALRKLLEAKDCAVRAMIEAFPDAGVRREVDVSQQAPGA